MPLFTKLQRAGAVELRHRHIFVKTYKPSNVLPSDTPMQHLSIPGTLLGQRLKIFWGQTMGSEP